MICHDGSVTKAAKRNYTSAIRREHADATRQRVVDAARELMLESGYASTTIPAVAERAGVAVQTVYASCAGGKAGLAKAVYDLTLAGDELPIPQHERPEVAAIIAEPDPVAKLRLYAAMATAIAERIGPVTRLLRAAEASALADGAVSELVDQTERERRIGSRGPAEHLGSLGLLRDGLTVERAADQIYALTAMEVYDRLTVVCGWTPDEFRQWLAKMLVATLLDGDR